MQATAKPTTEIKRYGFIEPFKNKAKRFANHLLSDVINAIALPCVYDYRLVHVYTR